MRFEIFLEGQGSKLVREGAVPDQLPRLELGGVSGFSSIVLWHSSFQIFRRANVFLVGEFDAADDVDVPH